MAGAAMWVVGDLVFVAAILGTVVRWMHREERQTRAIEAREDRDRAAIREREVRLAERLARERSRGLTGASQRSTQSPGPATQPAGSASSSR